MINVKKGLAHSLAQSDVRGLVNPTYAAGTASPIIAGQVCNVDTNGQVSPGNQVSSGGTKGIHGFAINNANDGDAIESGKIALYTLDGASIIETDQVDLLNVGGSATTLTAANFPIGTPVYISTATPGNVTIVSASSGNGQVGYVEGVRFLTRYGYVQAAASNTSQSYTSTTEANATQNASGISTANPVAGTAYNKPQVNIPILGIKLISGV